GIAFAIGHVNYQLRGAGSEADALFVRQWAEEHRVPFFSTTVDPHRAGASVQMVAREQRYAWLEDIREREGLAAIAVAHHQGDALETFFINLLRGSGLAGLKGIPVRNGRVIRPLLFATRAQLEAMAQTAGIPFREDPSNRSDDYLRNRIRHHLIPVLRDLDAGMEQHTAGTMDHLRAAGQILDRHLDELRKAWQTGPNGSLQIPIAQVQRLAPTADYLFLLLQPWGFNAATVANVLRSLDGQPGKRFLSASHELVKDRDHLILFPRDHVAGTASIEADTLQVEAPIELTFAQLPTHPETIDPNPHLAYLDFDQLQFPLTVRPWEQGDRFQPLGMASQQKVSDFLINQKVPLAEKAHTYVLESNGRIAWVIGHRIDDRFKIGEATKKIYLTRYLRP
ncbi:MAG: tRNA lysidine(34) synthetase TilS, partial [Bacteroidota bacterium]